MLCSLSKTHCAVRQRGAGEIGVGDLFYISYEVTNLDATPRSRPRCREQKVMYFERTGQSSRFSSVNGKTTQSFSYTYTLTLRAQKEGQYSFGPVTVGGVKSNAVNYAIGRARPLHLKALNKIPATPGLHKGGITVQTALSLLGKVTAISF